MAKQIKGYIRCLKCFHKFLRETAADKYCSDFCREAATSARRHEDSIARVNRAKTIRQPGCLFGYLETGCVEHLAMFRKDKQVLLEVHGAASLDSMNSTEIIKILEHRNDYVVLCAHHYGKMLAYYQEHPKAEFDECFLHILDTETVLNE